MAAHVNEGEACGNAAAHRGAIGVISEEQHGCGNEAAHWTNREWAAGSCTEGEEQVRRGANGVRGTGGAHFEGGTVCGNRAAHGSSQNVRGRAMQITGGTECAAGPYTERRHTCVARACTEQEGRCAVRPHTERGGKCTARHVHGGAVHGTR